MTTFSKERVAANAAMDAALEAKRKAETEWARLAREYARSFASDYGLVEGIDILAARGGAYMRAKVVAISFDGYPTIVARFYKKDGSLGEICARCRIEPWFWSGSCDWKHVGGGGAGLEAS